jgi:hypothetical protein
MSLLFTHEAKQVLEKHGLGDLVAVINKNREIEIAGKCGRTIFALTNMKFGKQNPTKREIEIGVQVLDDFLSKNADKIKEYTKLLEEANAPTNITKNGVMTSRYNYGKHYVFDSESTEDSMEISLKYDKLMNKVTETHFKIHDGSKIDFDELKKRIEKVYKQSVENMYELLKTEEAAEKLNKIKNELNLLC